jgi:PAS domain S-box-containing protein
MQMLGYGEDELKRMTVRDIHPKEDLARVVSEFQAQAKGGKTLASSIPCLRQDGTVIYADINTTVASIDGKQCNVGFFTDITERKQAGEALRDSEERYRTLFETMAQGVIYWAAYGAILMANPAAERILGLALDQMQGRTSLDPLWRPIHEDGSDFPGETHPAMVALQTGQPVRDVVMGVFNPQDDDYRWIDINAIPQFRPGEDRPYQVYTTFDDITERKRAEAALQRRTAQVRLLFEAGQRLGQSLDLETVLDTVHEVISQTMTCDSLVVSSYSPQEGLIRCLAMYHEGTLLDVSQFPPVALNPEGQGTQSIAIRSGQSLLLADYLQQRRTSQISYHVTQAGVSADEPPEGEDVTRSAIIVPLKSEGRVIGAVQVFSYRLNDFDQDDLSFLEALSPQIAAAMTHSLLYRQAQREIDERQRAEQVLTRRTSQLALLNEVGSQVAATLDLDEVLSRAAHLIHERFGFHHVGLFTRAEGEDRLVMRAKAGKFAHVFPKNHSTALGQGIVGWVGQHGETLLANDVTTEPRYRNPAPGRLPTRSELSVPIRIGDEVVGVLDLQSPNLNAFDPTDVAAKETLAGQLAVAIHNARLYSQAAQRNRELTLLNRVMAATATGDKVESILEVVCRELALAFDVPQAAATLFNEARTEAVVVAEYLAPGRPPALGARIPVVGNPASQHLLTNKTPLVIDDAQTDPRQALIRDSSTELAKVLVRQRGTVSLLLLPLIVDGDTVGSLGVDAIQPRVFSTEEINLAWRVAEQVSGVLARARLREERRQLRDQFHQAQKMEAVGRLAGGVAHDFNNLLTVIHLSTRLMEKKLSSESPLWQHVQRIQDAGQRAAGLTKQLLAFSRREIVEPKVLDLNHVLDELNKMLWRLIGEDIELVTHLADGLWPIRIDPTQIEQVVVNLAVNARDAMPTGGRLTIETANAVLDAAYAAYRLEVEAGEYVLLAISDNGVGMNDEVKAHLFEPFFTTKERGRGTGLGLATVFGIVKQNKGHIAVYSEPGQGTTFKIYLPRLEAGAHAAPEQPAERAAPLPRGSETVMLVEDETQVREMVKDALVAQGYRVLTAQDGVEALQVIEEYGEPVHLLITDVVMPRLGGRALADQLRPRHPTMRVLFTSGYTDDAIVQHGVLEEGIHFLSKPFELEALARKVREVLDAAD